MNINLLDCYATEISMKPNLKLITKDNLEEVINLTTGMVGFNSIEAAKNFSSFMRSLFPNEDMTLPDDWGFWNRIDQFHFEPSEWAFNFPIEDVTVERMYDFLIDNKIIDSDGHSCGNAFIREETGKIQLFACDVFDVKRSYLDWNYDNMYNNYGDSKTTLQYILDYPQLFEPIIHCSDCCGCGDW